MNLVEKHIIKRAHKLYNECDMICFKSKNLYNYALYRIKNEIEKENKYDILNNPYNYLKESESFCELPQKVSQQTLMMLQTNIKSFYKSIKQYNKSPDKYKAKPEFPKFKHKTLGRNVINYTYQSISKKVFKKTNKIKLSQCNIEFKTKIKNFGDICSVRIIPQNNQYTIEVVYKVNDVNKLNNNDRYCSIDLGVNNLATVTSNILKPFIINGKPLKSINQYYNKTQALYKSELKIKNNKNTSNKIKWLNNKRNNKVNDYLHKSSKMIVNKLKEENINTIIIGKNDNWKQDCEMGKNNTQNFVQIPHSRFIDMLNYKCELNSINVIIIEESYTSKASFFDLDKIPIYNTKNTKNIVFSGKRIKRGLYKSKSGKLINADVNGSLNIMRKAISNINTEYGIEACSMPQIINLII